MWSTKDDSTSTVKKPLSADRNLRGEVEKEALNDTAKGEFEVPEGARVTYFKGKRHLLRKENFNAEDEEAHFQRIYADYKHRNAQTTLVHEDDYADVLYWPYEWFIKVDTEYYFRYEGTQLIPPCFETVHWRIMKDPIRVHPRQIAELNRLLAWRRSPSGANQCDVDTAGVLKPGGDAVDLHRDTQYMHLQHRMVLCECKNWPSKFDSDKQWCRNWQNDPGYKRFYGTPYNFDTNGEW